MYAHRKLYVKQWEHQKPEDRYTVAIRRGGKSVSGIQADRISGVDEEVMYWRKANHIHGWFVDNVQDGKDDCGEYLLTEEKIRQLLEVCEKVIEASKLVDGTIYAGTVYNQEHPKGLVQRTAGKVIEDPTVAKKLLPTRQGCFFGNDEYDEYYLQDVIDTRDWAVRLLTDFQDGVPGLTFYSSSW